MVFRGRKIIVLQRHLIAFWGVIPYQIVGYSVSSSSGFVDMIFRLYKKREHVNWHALFYFEMMII